jgi:hypothetical protein
MDPGRREAAEVIMDIKKAEMGLLAAFILFLAPSAVHAGNRVMQDTLGQNEKLRASEELRSTNGQYTLVMQGDGNLVAYDSQGRSLWSSDTVGSRATECIMQGDGNLVLKDRKGRDVWATSTDGYRNAKLVIQNDGNLVIYNERGLAVWAKGRIKDSLSRDENLLADEFIRSQNRKYSLIMQGDGNLVAQDNQGRGIWNSNTVGSGATECVLQGDGNLVLKNRNGRAVWATSTDGHSNARLVIEDAGHVVLYSERGIPFWSDGNVNANTRRATPPLSTYNANTGDIEFDNALDNLNNIALADPDNFVNRLSSTYGISRPWVENLVKRENIPPADVYMIARTASVTNRPIDTLEQYYTASGGQGWGVIARRLGIRPGSKEFRALKQDDTGFLSQGKSRGQRRKEKDKS